MMHRIRVVQNTVTNIFTTKTLCFFLFFDIANTDDYKKTLLKNKKQLFILLNGLLYQLKNIFSFEFILYKCIDIN